MKRFPLTAVALLLAACAAHPTASTATPPTGPKTVIESHGIFLPVIDHDGTYLVNVDIFPGKYRNSGGTECNWARLRSVDTNDVIEGKKTSTPQVIMIRATDAAFLTQNCGVWHR
jgi:hypothetical protein